MTGTEWVTSHVAGRMSMTEWIRLPIWEGDLQRLDAELEPDLSNLSALLAKVPLAVWGAALLQPDVYFPRAHQWLPIMPTAAEQEAWTGASGAVLLEQSLAFIQSVVEMSSRHLVTPLREANVVDFGVGWGRLSRLLLKHVRPTHLFGLDAWPSSVELADSLRLSHPVVLTDARLQDPPLPMASIDLAYSFSVFTHLPPKVFADCLTGLRKILVSGGLFVMTIRPDRFWQDLRPEVGPERREDCPSGWEFSPTTEDGLFGDVTVDRKRLEFACAGAGFEVLGFEWAPVDAMQVLVVMRAVD